jgi:hypothetical protein
MNSDWLFCCPVRARSFLFADPMSLGMFELTKRPEARPEWETALQDYARQRAVVVDDNFIRARCFFLDTTSEDAHESGVLHAKELAGLLPLIHVMTSFEFVRVGFVANLRHGAALPLPPTFEEWQRRHLGITASIDELATEPGLTINNWTKRRAIPCYWLGRMDGWRRAVSNDSQRLRTVATRCQSPRFASGAVGRRFDSCVARQ